MVDSKALVLTKKCIQELLESAEKKLERKEVRFNTGARMAYDGKAIAYRTVLGIISDLTKEENDE